MKKLLILLITALLLFLCACGGNSSDDETSESTEDTETSDSDTDDTTLESMVEDIIADIIDSDMSDTEKARAVYDWVTENMKYSSRSSGGTWEEDAEFGLTRLSGECVVYFAVTKALLNGAGLETVDMEHINGSHIWNLVEIDGEWYHIDTTPQSDGTEIFLFTDSELEEYSASHDSSHEWDTSSVPATP